MGTFRRVVATFALAVLGSFGTSCSSDIFDLEVALDAQSYAFDFGKTQGTIPTVMCDPAAPGVCGSAPPISVDPSLGVPANVEVSLGCDAGSQHCFAQAAARVSQPMVVQAGDLARESISYVQFADIAYTVPSNSLTFQVPSVEIYAGPGGSQRETDPGVALLGTTAPIPAGATITTEQHLIIDGHARTAADRGRDPEPRRARVHRRGDATDRGWRRDAGRCDPGQRLPERRRQFPGLRPPYGCWAA
jgi:hypothetical protein